jgi:hypothetical protein
MQKKNRVPNRLTLISYKAYTMRQKVSQYLMKMRGLEIGENSTTGSISCD